MTPTIFLEETIDNAVRDICSVSVTGAPKSKVREIITASLTLQRKEMREMVEGMEEKYGTYQRDENSPEHKLISKQNVLNALGE